MTPTRHDLTGVRLLVFGSGSVAVLGLPHILLWLRDRLGLRHIRVILTSSATRLVTVESIRRVAGCETFAGWDDLPADARSHVSVADWADVAIVLPATANLLGKLAHGIGDDLATSTIMALSCPVIVVPATSATTWSKPAVRRNTRQLREDGFTVVEPAAGIRVAGDTTEPGSMGDYRKALLDALIQATAGTTRDIDTTQPARDSNRNGGLTCP